MHTGARRLHNNVEQLKEKLNSYGSNPFGAGKARYIATGKSYQKKLLKV